MSHKQILINPPRDLSSVERGILDRLLSINFPGRELLTKQASIARISEECEDCKSINFIIPDNQNYIANVIRRIPIEAEAFDIDGVKIHFLLHVIHGIMAELEIFREDLKDIQFIPEPSNLKLINLDEEII